MRKTSFPTPKSIISVFLALTMVFSAVAVSFAALTPEEFNRPINAIADVEFMMEIPPGPNDFYSTGDNVKVTAMHDPYGASGAVATTAMISSALNGSTLEQMVKNDPASAFFGAFGIHDLDDALGDMTIDDLLAFSINDLMPFVEAYNSGTDYNPREELLNRPIELIIRTVSSNTSKDDLRAIILVIEEQVKFTDVLESPTAKSALLTAVAFATETNVSQVGDTPIGELIVGAGNKLHPKPNGEKHADPLDLLVYVLDTSEGIKTARDMTVTEFLRRWINNKGEYNRTGDRMVIRYPAVYSATGITDSDSRLILNLPSFPTIDDVRKTFYFELDGKLLPDSQYTIETDTETGNPVVVVSGIFSQPGYHAGHLNIFGAPFYFHIDLSEPNVPVTGLTLDPTTAQMVTGDTQMIIATVIPSTATNKNVTFSSDNTGVATVDERGVVTAVAPGTATITVTTEDGGHTATCVITVIEPEQELSFCERLIQFLRNLIETLLAVFC